ncbi:MULTISPECIES: GntR family transcriptional regulator [Arthrobacter]|jgi:DNA-binding GntR family transcriptional regulator|uniref:DNA-binding GntR family transcriptional regulator n=1 Tax=Arthrobacter bambusae TaxID=1338426 RepID=A0AAW8DHJ1_9MICC|nr:MULTISPECIES: GntR family transcriptional regulator [Arthrobacter]MDP9907250.1 DNA-binding GntR family transcriptional regulator [Arthrobacter bambusae]MDQ0131387.1 DNA-binding GntR family transcriptional regulator [Arthrobacter bambusae]MDQ0182720.1 DNA-binding GntR family transcriptional regulator [Arthrobacter bambusae]MDQ0241834.1 DNA-binding GntR family transcriptional regulator [Arthrobacter bambusae]
MAAPEGMFVLEGRPTAQLIADQLRELIVQGAFKPGQQVNESALASQLNTSRGPLREALQRLCQEGILVSKRNRGVFVLELSNEDIKEIYAVREAVELAAANTLLDSGPDQIMDTCRELKGIIKNMAKQVAASDWQAIARLDMQFHTAFVSGTGNTRLIRIYETLAAESRMCILSLEVAYPRIDVLVQEHQDILDLLEARDQSGLQQAIKRHMQKAVEDLTSTRQPSGATA